MDLDEPIELYRARDAGEAHALRAMLEEAGIKSQIENELLQGLVGEIPGGWMTSPRLFVVRGQLDEAQAVLDVFLERAQAEEKSSDPGSLHCLACQSPMGDASTCPACGWTYGDAGAEPTSKEQVPPAEHTAATPDEKSVPQNASWGEVMAVLATGVIPLAIGAIVSMEGYTPLTSYWKEFLEVTTLNACTIYLTLYLIYRSGDKFRSFGVDRIVFLDLILGLMMFFLAVTILRLGYRTAGLFEEPNTSMFARPRRSYEYAMMVVMLFCSAYAEELVTRAYLITRLTVLLRSQWTAVVVSASLFALYHVYQGASGTVFALLFGLSFGIAYLAIRRVWPLAIGHALFNICLDLSN